MFCKFDCELFSQINLIGFPHAAKDDGEKIFVNSEMAKTQFASKHAPGPGYVYKDDIKYQTQPNFSFGTESKMDKLKPKYDFYENDRFIDDPIEADHARKRK